MATWINRKPNPIVSDNFVAFIQGIEIEFSKISGIENAFERDLIIEGGRNDKPHLLFKPKQSEILVTFERGVMNSGVSSMVLWAMLRAGKRLNGDIVVVVRNSKDRIRKVILLTDPIVISWKLGDLTTANEIIEIIEKDVPVKKEQTILLLETFTFSVGSVKDLPAIEFKLEKN